MSIRDDYGLVTEARERRERYGDRRAHGKVVDQWERAVTIEKMRQAAPPPPPPPVFEPTPGPVPLYVDADPSTLNCIAPRRLTIGRIIAALAAYLGDTEHGVMTSQMASHCRARQVGMYLARMHTPLSLNEIGRVFGRDGTTIWHGLRAFEHRLRRFSTSARERRRLEVIAALSGLSPDVNPEHSGDMMKSPPRYPR